jgi:hypothetical protein
MGQLLQANPHAPIHMPSEPHVNMLSPYICTPDRQLSVHVSPTIRPVQFTVAILNNGIVASTAAHIVIVVVVLGAMVVVMELVVLSIMELVVLSIIELEVLSIIELVVLSIIELVVLSIMELVVLDIIVVVLVDGPLGQNILPLRRLRSHTNGIFKLHRKSFHDAGITASA